MICCNDFQDAVDEIAIWWDPSTQHFYFHGKPDFVDDGDNVMDDMTAEIPINNCPFCGTKLECPHERVTKYLHAFRATYFEPGEVVGYAECCDCGKRLSLDDVSKEAHTKVEWL